MRGEVLILVNIPNSHFLMSLTHSALSQPTYEYVLIEGFLMKYVKISSFVCKIQCFVEYFPMGKSV